MKLKQTFKVYFKQIWFVVGLINLINISVLAQSGDRFYNLAIQKYKLKKYKEGIVLFDKAIEAEPKNSVYYFSRGKAFSQLNDALHAFEDYSVAINNDPTYSEAYLERGKFFFHSEAIDKSIVDFLQGLKFVKVDSIKTDLLLGLASAQYDKMNYTDSENYCREVLKIDSNNVIALNNLARSYDATDKSNEALICLKKIVQIDSTFPYSYMNLGFYLSTHQKYSESLTYFDLALKYKGTEAIILNNRGYSKMMLNDLDGAMKDINKSLKIDNTNSYAFKNRGQLFVIMGDSIKGCTDFYQAVNLGFTKRYGTEVENLIKENCR